MPQTRPSNLPKLSSAQRHVLALLRRDYPTAFQHSSSLLQSRSWQARDLALAGLGDILDRRIIEQGKTPMLVYVVGWQPIAPPSPVKTALSADRLLALLDTFMYASQRQPHTLSEFKHLQIFKKSKQLLEKTLLGDPNALVRSR
jgi:hypothetical protein